MTYDTGSREWLIENIGYYRGVIEERESTRSPGRIGDWRVGLANLEVLLSQFEVVGIPNTEGEGMTEVLSPLWCFLSGPHPEHWSEDYRQGNYCSGRPGMKPNKKEPEVYTWYTADQCRCFVGKGYSEEYCSQRFDTFAEARAHADEYHAAPEYETIAKHTLQTVEE